MSRVQVLRCDGPTCKEQVEDRDGDPRQPSEWTELRQEGCYPVHFCSKGCLAEWAATEAKHAAKDSDEAAKWRDVAAASHAVRAGITVVNNPSSVLHGMTLNQHPTVDVSKPFGCWPHDTGDWSHTE